MVSIELLQDELIIASAAFIITKIKKKTAILHLTLGFNILRKDNCKPRRETFKFCDLVRLR